MGDDRVPLRTIAREWTRLGLLGFGGPPAHISMMRRRFVDQRGWLDEHEFTDAIAATNLLPGPASTQLAIFCGWRLRRVRGALVAGVCFILPGLVVILGLAAVFLAHHPPKWIVGIADGAGAAIPAVALAAAIQLMPATWGRIQSHTAARARALLYVAAGATVTIVAGPYLVIVLVATGVIEIVARTRPRVNGHPLVAVATAIKGSWAGLSWVAFKVGALSYGGGFVIIPLMAHDATVTYHWMSGPQFLSAVALGQVTPGPVVQTVAVVGYAAHGILGGVIAAVIAFAPSFVFVIVGARHFNRLRADVRVSAFLAGAGVAVVAAIAASAVPLANDLRHLWELAPALVALGVVAQNRRNTLVAIVTSGLIGLVAVACGAAFS